MFSKPYLFEAEGLSAFPFGLPPRISTPSSFVDGGIPSRDNRSTGSVGSALSYQSAASLGSAFSQCSGAVMAGPPKKGRKRYARASVSRLQSPVSRLQSPVPRAPSPVSYTRRGFRHEPSFRSERPTVAGHSLQDHVMELEVSALEEEICKLKSENTALKTLSEERQATIARLTRQNARLKEQLRAGAVVSMSTSHPAMLFHSHR